MSDSDFSPEFGSPYQVLVDHCESAGLKFRAEPDVKGVFFSMRGEMAIYDVALDSGRAPGSLRPECHQHQNQPQSTISRTSNLNCSSYGVRPAT